jgi:hypothetical protein
MSAGEKAARDEAAFSICCSGVSSRDACAAKLKLVGKEIVASVRRRRREGGGGNAVTLMPWQSTVAQHSNTHRQ